MSVAAKVSAFVVLALLCGVGVVYAPVPTFAPVAATFALGLWLLLKDGPPALSGPRAFAGVEVPVGAGEKGRKPRSTLTTKLVSGYLFIWRLALIAPLAAYTPRGETTSGVGEAAASGSLRNQVLIASFGLVGALFLPAAIKRLDPAFRWVAVLWTLYLCWVFASLYWSIYLPLTFRNVGALVLVTVGCFGLGAGFYGRHPNGRDLFLRHVFVGGVLSALVILVPLPFYWEQYDLLDPSQRLAISGNFPTYVVRPVMCALLVLVATAILGVREWRRRDWFWVAGLVLPVLALKTRGPVLWAIVAFSIFYLLYKVRARDRVLQAGLLLVVGLGVYVGAFGSLVPYLTRGNVQGAMTLTGRIPLWEVLISETGQRPWLGSGFAAFSNPDNIYRIEQLLGRESVSAHNGLLSALLNTGVIGLVILLAFLISAMAVALRRARRGDPFGWMAFLFVVFYFLLNVTNDLIGDYFQIPFVVILMILALMASQPMTSSPTTIPRRAPGVTRERVASPR